MLHRARQLTLGGAELLFADLHEDVAWSGSELAVAIRHDAAIPLLGRGLLMVGFVGRVCPGTQSPQQRATLQLSSWYIRHGDRCPR